MNIYPPVHHISVLLPGFDLKILTGKENVKSTWNTFTPIIKEALDALAEKLKQSLETTFPCTCEIVPDPNWSQGYKDEPPRPLVSHFMYDYTAEKPKEPIAVSNDLTYNVKEAIMLLENRSYMWKPQEDITTYELALNAPLFVAANSHFNCFLQAYDILPDSAKRHWTPIPTQR